MAISGYIAIDGPIGVGKTTLASRLANLFNGRLVEELAEENPFLSEFYKDRDRYAFQTQIFFLMSRYAQQEQLFSQDLFSKCTIADYMFAKDRIFAKLNLSENEMALYDRVASALEKNVSNPDLVIYLTASVDSLVDRIKKRGRAYEKSFDRDYLTYLCEVYSNYFFHYDKSPLLVIKTDNVDLSIDNEKIEYLAEKISSQPTDTEYISFDSHAIG